jgi:hypothetical protein
MRRCIVMLLLVAIIASPAAFMQAGDKKEPDKKEPDKKGEKSFLLVVPPVGGKEIKLVDWRFTSGTRWLDLTGAAPKDPKTKAPAGIECLEFREEKSTTYKNGINTFIPLASVRKLDYDRDKKTVSAVAIKDDGTEVTLVGSTKSTSNKITIEAEAILDGLGAATVKFHGGVDKGLHSVAFPAPKPAEKVKGAPAVVTADDKEKTKHTVTDLQPVYLVDGQYRVVAYLMFKKTVKIDMDKLVGLRYVAPEDKKKASNDYEVTLKDGAKHTLSILTVVELEKKKTMTFVGLIGRVPVGYKLFMLDAIYEFYVGAPKEKLDTCGTAP